MTQLLLATIFEAFLVSSVWPLSAPNVGAAKYMNPVSTQVMLSGIADLVEAFRPQVEAALQTPPLTLLSLTMRPDAVIVEVQYDGDDHELNERLLSLVIERVHGAIPTDRFDSDAYSFVDPELGSFFFDEHWWEGECDVEGRDEPLPIHLITDGEEVPTDELRQRARQVVQDFTGFDQQWKEIAVREMFDNFNQNWNEGPPLSIEAFRAALDISSVDFKADGWTTAYYFAGDLFREHDIDVAIGPSGEVQVGLVG